MGMQLNNWVPADELAPTGVLLAEGEGTFVVKDYYDTDKNGLPLLTKESQQPKVNLLLVVTDHKGDKGTVYDTITPNTLFKAHNVCASVGRPDLYAAEFKYEELKGLGGRCKIKVKDGQPGYPQQNEIVYLKPLETKTPIENTIEDDELSF